MDGSGICSRLILHHPLLIAGGAANLDGQPVLSLELFIQRTVHCTVRTVRASLPWKTLVGRVFMFIVGEFPHDLCAHRQDGQAHGQDGKNCIHSARYPPHHVFSSEPAWNAPNCSQL